MQSKWRLSSRLRVIIGLLTAVVTVNVHASAVKSIGRSVDVELGGVSAKQRVVFCKKDKRPKIVKLGGQRNWCVAGAKTVCASDKLAAAKKACSLKTEVSENKPQVATTNAKTKGAESVAAQKASKAPAASADKATSPLAAARVDEVSKLEAELKQVESSMKQIQEKLDSIDMQRANLIKQKEALQ